MSGRFSTCLTAQSRFDVQAGGLGRVYRLANSLGQAQQIHFDTYLFDYWKVGPGQGQYHDPKFITSTDGVPYDSRNRRLGTITPGYYTDLVTDFALQWLKERKNEKPFFLMLHHKAPHGKWEPADRHKNYLADVEIPEPDTLWEDFSHRSEATRQMGTSITGRLAGRRTMVDDVQKPNWPAGSVDMTGMSEKEKGKAAYQKYLHDYLGCVKAVDENVGRVLDYLDEAGLAENTLVIYTADQGMFLGEHDYFDKRWIYEECFQMPFLARLPGSIEAGSLDGSHLLNAQRPILQRRTLHWLVRSGCLACVFAVSLTSSAAEERPPNILLIITDQQHADMMSCAGNKFLNTPAMDSLARNGIRFTNAYVTNPVCVPSRISMATGVMAGRLGVLNNGVKARVPLEVDNNSLGKLLKRAGYDTFYGGKVHMCPELNPLDAGYDEYLIRTSGDKDAESFAVTD